MTKQDHNMSIVDDDFDVFLRGQLQQTQPYLMDDNFTAQVIRQLPVQKKLRLWQERLIIIFPLIIISLLVLSQFSLTAVLIKLWVLLLTVDTASLLKIGFLTTLFAVSGASFWCARQIKII